MGVRDPQGDVATLHELVLAARVRPLEASVLEQRMKSLRLMGPNAGTELQELPYVDAADYGYAEVVVRESHLYPLLQDLA